MRVEMLSHTEFCLKTIHTAFKQCYSPKSATDLNFYENAPSKAQAIRNAARQGANSALKEVELSFVIGPRPYIVHRTIKMSVYETLLYLDKNCCMLEHGKAQDLALAVLAQCAKCIPDVFYGASAICADKVCCPRDISCGEIYKCSDIFGGCAPVPVVGT